MALHESQPGMPLHPRGSLVALPTPFRDGTVDEQCLAQLCERQVARGITALVVCGSTGEAAALRPEEYARVVRSTVIAAASRVPVIAGCGALSTADAAHLAKIAAQSGVTGLLCAPPPYVRPTPDGVICHFEVIQQATELPVLLYDVPGRTGIIVSDETDVRLAAHPAFGPSAGSILRIPTQTSRRFRSIPAGDSDGSQPLIPRHSSHP